MKCQIWPNPDGYKTWFLAVFTRTLKNGIIDFSIFQRFRENPFFSKFWWFPVLQLQTHFFLKFWQLVNLINPRSGHGCPGDGGLLAVVSRPGIPAPRGSWGWFRPSIFAKDWDGFLWFIQIYIYRLLRIIGMVSILLLMIQIYFYSTPVPGKVADGLLVFRLGWREPFAVDPLAWRPKPSGLFVPLQPIHWVIGLQYLLIIKHGLPEDPPWSTINIYILYYIILHYILYYYIYI